MLSTRSCRVIYKIDPPLLQPSLYLYSTIAHHRSSYSTKTSTATDLSKPSLIPTTAPETSHRNVLDSDSSQRLNPPASTRPPPLNLPERDSSQPAYRYYYQLGRAYFTFYKTGLKNIYTNYKLTETLSPKLASLRPEEAVRAGAISRAEWLTMKRLRADITRLPFFGLVFCICGEFTPLVVLVISGIVPRSLWIPKQVSSAREKMEARRRETFRNADPTVERVLKNKDADALSEKAVVLHIGRSLGLYSNLWDRVRIPPTPLIRRRVRERIGFVELDDAMIERDGGVSRLDEEEMRMAAELRGIDICGKKEHDVKKVLGEWLEARKTLSEKGRPATSLYLARPAAWLR